MQGEKERNRVTNYKEVEIRLQCTFSTDLLENLKKIQYIFPFDLMSFHTDQCN